MKTLLDIATGYFYWKSDYSGSQNKHKAGDRADIKCAKGYMKVKQDGQSVCAHRLIYEILFGKIPDGLEVDHINDIRDDNRLSNLRLVTKIENEWHRCLKAKNMYTQPLGKSGTYFVRFKSMPYPELFPEFNIVKSGYQLGKLSLIEAENLVLRVKESIETYLDKIQTFQQLLDNQ